MNPAPHILIVSTKVDISTDAVVRNLESRAVQCTRLNTEDFPLESSLTWTVSSDADQANYCFQPPNSDLVNLRDVTAIWYRRVRTPDRPPTMLPGVYDFCTRESRTALIGSLLTQEKRVMSHPTSIWAAEHKPLQLYAAHKVGLGIPDTVITNDPREVRAAFTRFNGRMIAKPVRTGFVDYGSEQHAIYTSQVLQDHLVDLDSARLSPVIYQPLIEKECDVRVTAVGNKLFVAEIDSQSDPAAVVDWRKTANPMLPHRKSELPSEVCEQIHLLLAALNLKFGAIDLIRTKRGELIFLEVNPNGQWLWLDDQLGFGITEAISEWLSAREHFR
ncbi:hypothetical protein WDW86_12115 [Bdellovibrionota bacterium FG-2]